MSYLTEHFSMEELTHSVTAEHYGIDNDPKCVDERLNLVVLARSLEALRGLAGHWPILVTSGYRCKELNRRVGGTDDSAHQQGRAADFHCPGLEGGTEKLFRLAVGLARARPYFADQIIWERGRRSHWVHLSVPPLIVTGRRVKPELSLLVASFSPKTGKMVYDHWRD